MGEPPGLFYLDDHGGPYVVGYGEACTETTAVAPRPNSVLVWRGSHRPAPGALLREVPEGAGPVRTEFWFWFFITLCVLAIFTVGFVLGFIHGLVGLS